MMMIDDENKEMTVGVVSGRWNKKKKKKKNLFITNTHIQVNQTSD